MSAEQGNFSPESLRSQLDAQQNSKLALQQAQNEHAAVIIATCNMLEQAKGEIVPIKGFVTRSIMIYASGHSTAVNANFSLRPDEYKICGLGEPFFRRTVVVAVPGREDHMQLEVYVDTLKYATPEEVADTSMER